MRAVQREGVLLSGVRFQVPRSRALAQPKAEVHLSTFRISGIGRLTLPGACQQRVGGTRWTSAFGRGINRRLMAEAGHSRRSAIRQFDRDAGRCQPRATLDRLCSRRRSADPVPSVSDAPRRRAADERVETGQAQSAAPGRPSSGNWTHRTTRTRGHATCPSAAASIRRSRRLSGSQEPPRATNRLAASMMGPPLP